MLLHKQLTKKKNKSGIKIQNLVTESHYRGIEPITRRADECILKHVYSLKVTVALLCAKN